MAHSDISLTRSPSVTLRNMATIKWPDAEQEAEDLKCHRRFPYLSLRIENNKNEN